MYLNWVFNKHKRNKEWKWVTKITRSTLLHVSMYHVSCQTLRQQAWNKAIEPVLKWIENFIKNTLEVTQRRDSCCPSARCWYHLHQHRPVIGQSRVTWSLISALIGPEEWWENCLLRCYCWCCCWLSASLLLCLRTCNNTAATAASLCVYNGNFWCSPIVTSMRK